MALIYRGALTSRWSQKVSLAICALAFSFQLGGWAQTLPQPPINSDAAFRLLPSKLTSLGLDSEILHEQPLIRVIAEAGVTYLGFDPLIEVGDAFEGTVIGAIVSDPKKASSFGAFIKDGELRSEREQLVAEVQSVASDLESYKEQNDSYPVDYKTFIDEFRYYEPYLPPGASLDYQLTEGGKGFRLAVKYTEPSRFTRLGPPPVVGSDGLTEHLSPEVPALPLNFVLGARVADQALARDLMDRLMGSAKDGFWQSPDQPPMVVTLRGPWLVATDRKENLGPFLKALNGQAPGLDKNPRFQTVARNIDMRAPGMLFLDLPRLVKSVDLTMGPDERRLLETLGPAGYSLTPLDRAQMRMEAFVSLTPPKGSDLAGILAESADAKPADAMVAKNIPWDVSNAFAADYRQSKRLFDAVVALSPEAKETLDLVEDVWAGFLGLDAEAGFDQLVDGWVIVSFERLDIFVNAFEGFNEAFSNPPEMPDGTGGPDGEDVESVVTPSSDADSDTEPGTETEADDAPIVIESDEEPSAVEEATPVESDPSALEPADDDEKVEVDVELDGGPELLDVVTTPKPDKPARLPFTMAFQVTDEQARAALLEAIAKQLGDDIKMSTVYGVEVTGRQDGLLSYALLDDWFYVSGGNTQRLLRNMLAAATGRKESLTSLSTWTRFREQQRGQVIAIGHQKVDAMYSLVKGFLLFMGPDFRPLAYEMGGLRDYHSAAFVVPDGLLMVGDILQGDGR